MTIAIAARGVRKVYGPTPVLDRVDLETAAGECVALLGPNGAGKTTLLRLFATIIRPTGGRLSILGHEVPRHAERVRGSVGLVGHGSHLYEDLTAAENLRVWATLAGQPADRTTLARALATVELDSVADERVRTFSAGMRRRLSLARFVSGDVRLLLLDEPFSALDQRGKKWLEGFLDDFKARGGAIVMATHSFGRGLQIADRVAILAGGAIVMDRPRSTLELDELEQLYAFHTEES